MPQSSPPFRRLPAFLTVGVVLAGQLVAQAPVRLAQETPLLKDPGGTVVATLAPGLRLNPGRSSGSFLEVTVSGWIFTASTTADRREGFDLAVSAGGGENLRASPDGPVIGKAAEGALFKRLGRSGGWTQVRRTGWISRPVVASKPADPPAPKPAIVRAAAPADSPPPQPVASAAPPVDSAAPALRGALKPGVLLQRTPDGESFATVAAPLVVTLGQRDREWVKVIVEAWVRQTDVQGGVAPLPAITGAMLRENPDKYIGQTVDWRLQFLARQQADELRPEMPLGHPYLLARGPLPESGFVYVLISREQAEQLQGLKPLDEIAARVTVRNARTRYLATPVVELIRIGDGK